MRTLVEGWRDAGMFVDQLGGWRDEEYTIYGPKKMLRESNSRNVAFRLERSACALFSLLTFGVQCTAYIAPTATTPLKLWSWIPRRSSTKQTWPSYLDNTIAGGITLSATPLSSILRECTEEASLPASFVSPRLTSSGIISYVYRNEKYGWIQPEVQYVYDLLMDDPVGGGVAPSTNVEDGEVESFALREREEVERRMRGGEFTPTCALVLIDFLIRHGYVTAENEGEFIEITTRL